MVYVSSLRWYMLVPVPFVLENGEVSSASRENRHYTSWHVQLQQKSWGSRHGTIVAICMQQVCLLLMRFNDFLSTSRLFTYIRQPPRTAFSFLRSMDPPPKARKLLPSACTACGRCWEKIGSHDDVAGDNKRTRTDDDPIRPTRQKRQKVSRSHGKSNAHPGRQQELPQMQGARGRRG